MTPLRRLQSGDRIALVAPASSFPPEQLDAGVAELHRLGFDATYNESVFAKARFVAGPASVRAQAIHEAWADRSVAALVAMRGGYGSAELLPLLDARLMQTARKALIGYSDITALLALYLNHGMCAIHGPMIERRFASGPAAYDEASFRLVTMTTTPAGPLQPETLETLHSGDAAGVLLGGTLTQITSLLGTPWALTVPHGAILFLEDVAERPYRVHRMLTQLRHAGVLRHVRGIVFGEFTRCDEPGGEPAIRDVLRDFTADLACPVVFGFPSGHTTGATWTLPFGVRARVVGGPDPVVEILDAAVE